MPGSHSRDGGGGSCRGLLFPISMLPTQPTTHEYCQGGPRVSEGYLGGQVPKDESRRGDLLHDAPKSLALASKDSSSASHCLGGVDQPLCSEALCPHGNSSFWQAVSQKPQVGMSMRACISVCPSVSPEQAPTAPLPKVRSLLFLPG